MKTALCLLVLLPTAGLAAQNAAPPPADDSLWIRDFELARSRAFQEQRDLLMVFMGPSDDGADQRLETEILAKPEFVAAAAKQFVLARFDFPKDAAQVPAALQQQYARVRQKFESPRLPVVWLTDNATRPYARVGYRPGGPAAFVEVLDAKRQAHLRAEQALARAGTLQGAERAKALADGLRCLDDHIVGTVHYREMLEVINTDASGALGLKDEFDAIGRDGAMAPLLARTQDELRPLLAGHQWDQLDQRIAALPAQHGDARWARQYAALLAGVRKADGDGDPAAALAQFTAALALAPRSELAPEIEQRRRDAAAAVEAAAERARKAAEQEQRGKKKKK